MTRKVSNNIIMLYAYRKISHHQFGPDSGVTSMVSHHNTEVNDCIVTNVLEYLYKGQKGEAEGKGRSR